VVAAEQILMVEVADLGLLFSVTLALNVAQAAQSHLLADTPITHLLLQGHLQHEPLC
jgi:hypothetical protein